MLIYQYLLILVCLICCWAERVVVDWNIGYLEVNRDGHFTRKAIGVNGKLPVPPVYITSGDTLILNVVNSLDQPTTVHAHGIFQKGTNHMDGAGMVTQCGIPPGTNFTYEYTVEQAGTYWLHGHFNHQNSEGLRTPFIVYDTDELPMQYDEDVVVSLEDWYPVMVADRMKEVLDPTKPFPPPPTYPYGLINGINGNDTQVIVFEPGKKYRFRVLNMGSTEWFKFTLPGHKLHVIEADGVYCEPQEVDGLSLGPGQRYSAVVEAKQSAEFNYVYNATLFANFVPNLPGLNPRYYTGLIQYREGAPIKQVDARDDSEIVWAQDIKMQAFDRQPLLAGVSRTVSTIAGSQKFSDNVTRAILHKYPYMTPPIVPTLFSAMSMGALASDSEIYGPQTEAQVIGLDEVIEIVMTNDTPIDHSMHLHGHNFQITEYGPASSNNNSSIPIQRCGGYPMRRDTFVVPALHYIRVRFLANNPGVWLFHCHMDIHFALGLAMTFVEAPEVLQKTQSVPEQLKKMCVAQGLKAEGNGAGNQGMDLTGLPAPPH
ncbi:ferroxidase fet3 [Coemansia asiatica]|uniref:Ferroxidase fet3 n=1 Tax=Coemansia asiatica TaxID=1052880 RepID=A0A9W7XFK3_9FUNG|nr:ferroxidase fet3 [Coemansia asiatica]